MQFFSTKMSDNRRELIQCHISIGSKWQNKRGVGELMSEQQLEPSKPLFLNWSIWHTSSRATDGNVSQYVKKSRKFYNVEQKLKISSFYDCTARNRCYCDKSTIRLIGIFFDIFIIIIYHRNIYISFIHFKFNLHEHFS